MVRYQVTAPFLKRGETIFVADGRFSAGTTRYGDREHLVGDELELNPLDFETLQRDDAFQDRRTGECFLRATIDALLHGRPVINSIALKHIPNSS